MAVYLGALPKETEGKSLYKGTRTRDVVGVRPAYVDGHVQDSNHKPHVILAEYVPGRVTPPHYHEIKQFQFFLAGSGTLGKHPLRPGTIHWTNAYTIYGPLVAGEEGLTYIVLRQEPDPIVRYMPKSESLRPKRKRREVVADIDFSQQVSGPIAGPFEDGLEMYRECLPEGSELPFSAPEHGDGQGGVIVGGSLVKDGQSYDLWSCVWADRGEEIRGLRAGPGGADIVVLRFPVEATA